MTWLFILLGVAVVAIGLLAAVGALGELTADDDLAGAHEDHIPTELFGYRKDVVDRLLEQARSERVNESEDA